MRLDYYLQAARHAGVPPMWLEDAAQDIAVRVWQAGQDTVMVVRHSAIDAARHYGDRTRAGDQRLRTVAMRVRREPGFADELAWDLPDPAPTPEAQVVGEPERYGVGRIRRGLAKLTPVQRRGLRVGGASRYLARHRMRIYLDTGTMPPSHPRAPKRDQVTCRRCGHRWAPNVAHPKRCVACGSARWYKPRKQRRRCQRVISA